MHVTSASDKAHLRSQGCEIKHELIDATAVACPANVNIPNSEADKVLQILDASSDKQIKADLVWPAGYTGFGMTVAVLDTGVDTTHPELSSSIVGGQSFVSYTTSFTDDNGHGTHVSGIITSDGTSDPNSKGVAPGAGVWMAKVCDAGGSCYTSDIAAAIQDVVTNHIAKVMSISIGGSATTASNCDSDYLASQINWAYDNGVVSAVAAGNWGGTRWSTYVTTPACASKAIAVAAVDSSDNLASFSSYGAALQDHGVAAPGVNIYSTVPKGSCELCSSTGYAYMDGTSMATPHVSATVALTLQRNPKLTPDDIRAIIFGSADCLNNKYGTCPNMYIGHGRVDAYNAVSSTPSASGPFLLLSANPPSITMTQSSTVTASTSDGKSGVTISFSTNLGSLSATTCSTTTGKCSVTFSPSTTGTATIAAFVSDSSYTAASTTVTVTSPPPTISVSVTTNKATYKKGSTVTITVTVTSSGVAVSGATVGLTISDPSAATVWTKSGTTAGGKVTFTYVIPNKSGFGVYTAKATASATGYTSGSGSATFNVSSK